jgi:hypothetical protein
MALGQWQGLASAYRGSEAALTKLLQAAATDPAALDLAWLELQKIPTLQRRRLMCSAARLARQPTR